MADIVQGANPEIGGQTLDNPTPGKIFDKPLPIPPKDVNWEKVSVGISIMVGVLTLINLLKK